MDFFISLLSYFGWFYLGYFFCLYGKQQKFINSLKAEQVNIFDSDLTVENMNNPTSTNSKIYVVSGKQTIVNEKGK